MYTFRLCGEMRRKDPHTALNWLSSYKSSRSKHSLPFATVNLTIYQAPNLLKYTVWGNWTRSSKWNTLVDPLNGEPFIKVAEIDVGGVQPFVESLSKCPKHGLHNPFKAPKRYLLYGHITAKAAHMLSCLRFLISSLG